MTEAGFDLLPGEHPIVPVMLGDAKLAQTMAARMLELGVYVIGFSLPGGAARRRRASARRCRRPTPSNTLIKRSRRSRRPAENWE